MSTNSPDTPPTSAARSRKWPIVSIAGCALLLVALLVYEFDAHDRGTDDAYVTGHLHVISPRVAGTVERVLVNDNQFVHAGDPLVRLDPRDFDVRVALQRARVAQARSDASRAKALVEQAEATLVSAHADAEKAELDYARARELTRETPRGLSQQEFDAANAARKSARARIEAAEAQRRSAQAAQQAADAVSNQNDAELRDAELQRQYTTVVAPSDGYVGKKTVETGEHVAPGQALLTLVEPHPWVVANFRETQLRHVRAGDVVQLRFDALPDRTFSGHVDSLSPATGGQFSLLPPDNATGNFTKVTQRVPVKILLDGPASAEPRIRPGLSVVVSLQRGRTQP